MATTPVTRVTDLTRRMRLDVDTATFPAVNYEQLIGVEELKLIEELRSAPDETYTDDGAMREEVTGYAWRLEGKLKNSLNLAGTSRNAVHTFLRQKFIALRSAAAAQSEFGIRFYDRNGIAGEASEGRVYVKVWNTEGPTSSQDLISFTLMGQGPLAEITNPAASQVPAVSGLSPATGAADGGELVNVYGNHFTGATDVDFAADAADFTIVSDSHIVAVAPAHAAGTVQVKVTTAAGASANVAADDYVYV